MTIREFLNMMKPEEENPNLCRLLLCTTLASLTVSFFITVWDVVMNESHTWLVLVMGAPAITSLTIWAVKGGRHFGI